MTGKSATEPDREQLDAVHPVTSLCTSMEY